MDKREMLEIMEEESMLPKCICCNMPFAPIHEQLICDKCGKSLNDTEYNILVGNSYKKMRKSCLDANIYMDETKEFPIV